MGKETKETKPSTYTKVSQACQFGERIITVFIEDLTKLKHDPTATVLYKYCNELLDILTQATPNNIHNIQNTIIRINSQLAVMKDIAQIISPLLLQKYMMIDDYLEHFNQPDSKSYQFFKLGLEKITQDTVNDCIAVNEAKVKSKAEEQVNKVAAFKKAFDEQKIKEIITNINKALKEKNIYEVVSRIYLFGNYINECYNKAKMDYSLVEVKLFMEIAFADLFASMSVENHKLIAVLQDVNSSHDMSYQKEDKSSFTNILYGLCCFRDMLQYRGYTKVDYDSNFDAISDEMKPIHHMIRLVNTTPLQKIPEKIDTLFNDSESKNYFRQKFVKYQVEHANDIYQAQIPLQKAIIKKTKEEKKESKLSENELLSLATTQTAKEFILCLKNIIINTDWNVKGWKSGLKILFKHKGEIGGSNRIPENMGKIFQAIKDAEKSERWQTGFEEIAKIGKQAAEQWFTFGRSDESQALYDTLKDLHDDPINPVAGLLCPAV